LPSTRSLAEDLKLSRNTLLSAFEQLHDEGYVTSQVGSGTRVAQTLPEDFSETEESKATENTDSNKGGAGLSLRGTVAAGEAQTSYEVQPFAPGEDDFSAFPTQLWRRLLNRQWRDPQPAYLDYGHAGGYLPLRRAIANYLRMSRAVNLTVEQILITSGTQQSIDLCARLLTDHGDLVWVENPCYWGARRVLEVNGLELHPVQVDEEGISPGIDDFRRPPRLIYTTPSHQYPKGVVMSYGRRRLLLDYAASIGSWILEDDYDSEFRFGGHPLSSLQGMDQTSRVLYLGTFSKVMYPGIKLGYLVVPADLAESFKFGLYQLQRPGQVVIQAALAEFIEEGHFASHIRRLRQIYGERRRLLQEALSPITGTGASLPVAGSGLHLMVGLPSYCDDVRIADLAAEQGLRVYPLSCYGIGENREKGLIIGYAYAATERITHYGGILADVIQAALATESRSA
jgi:GntR family transcriptional regulator/MocR family aminotransferase